MDTNSHSVTAQLFIIVLKQCDIKYIESNTLTLFLTIKELRWGGALRKRNTGYGYRLGMTAAREATRLKTSRHQRYRSPMPLP